MKKIYAIKVTYKNAQIGMGDTLYSDLKFAERIANNMRESYKQYDSPVQTVEIVEYNLDDYTL